MMPTVMRIRKIAKNGKTSYLWIATKPMLMPVVNKPITRGIFLPTVSKIKPSKRSRDIANIYAKEP